MPIQRIPDDVRRFIQTSIDSIAQLEALLIAHELPDAEWTVATMAARLYISPERTAAILARLCGDRLMVTVGAGVRYKYEPDSDELRRMVDRLAEAYAKYLVPITRLVHSKEVLRIREFPDAFDFRKERP